MKHSRQVLAVTLAAAGLAAAATGAEPRPRGSVARVAPKATVAAKAAAATTASRYSVEVPYVRSYAPPGGGQGGTLVLNQAHSFDVSLVATNQHNGNVTGAGVALPQTDTFGYFSLPSITNNPSNPEVFVKILDGRTQNGNYWVFYGHLTDLIYDLTVKDNVTQATKTYHKEAGNTPGGFDTGTFPAASGSPVATKAAPGALPDAYIRTSVDIANNTNTDNVTATLQYCYSINGAFQSCSHEQTITLAHLYTFHQDDIVAYLGARGVLAPGAEQNSLGTLLVTFDNLPSQQGWEGTVTATTYNRVSEVDPLRGTVGCGPTTSYFFESATHSLVGTARDTVPAPSLQAGSLGTTLGVRNTDVLGIQGVVTVNVTLYDPATGQPAGNTVTLSNLAPGELRLIDDLFSAANVPPSITTAIVYVDTLNSSTNSPTVEGFLLTQDTDSGDTRFHELKCAAGCL